MKQILQEYTLLITPDPESGWFTVEVPALPGCLTQGKTLAKAIENAKEAVALWLEVYQERHNRIPADETPNFFTAKISVPLSKIHA